MIRLAPLWILLAACGSAPRVDLTPEEQALLAPYADELSGIDAAVARGDESFVRAISAQRQGAVKEALNLYLSARASYGEALKINGSRLPVPPPLMQRSNETTKRVADMQRQLRTAK